MNFSVDEGGVKETVISLGVPPIVAEYATAKYGDDVTRIVNAFFDGEFNDIGNNEDNDNVDVGGSRLSSRIEEGTEESPFPELGGEEEQEHLRSVLQTVDDHNNKYRKNHRRKRKRQNKSKKKSKRKWKKRNDVSVIPLGDGFENHNYDPRRIRNYQRQGSSRGEEIPQIQNQDITEVAVKLRPDSPFCMQDESEYLGSGGSFLSGDSNYHIPKITEEIANDIESLGEETLLTSEEDDEQEEDMGDLLSEANLSHQTAEVIVSNFTEPLTEEEDEEEEEEEVEGEEDEEEEESVPPNASNPVIIEDEQRQPRQPSIISELLQRSIVSDVEPRQEVIYEEWNKMAVLVTEFRAFIIFTIFIVISRYFIQWLYKEDDKFYWKIAILVIYSVFFNIRFFLILVRIFKRFRLITTEKSLRKRIEESLNELDDYVQRNIHLESIDEVKQVNEALSLELAQVRERMGRAEGTNVFLQDEIEKEKAICKASREELEGLKDKNLCTICFENDANTALESCGHVYCDSCVYRMRRNKKCPVCRKGYRRPIKLFRS